MPRLIDVERAVPAPAGKLQSWRKESMGLETRPPPVASPTADCSEAAPGESSAPSPPPRADDLGAIKKAVDDAASLCGGLWLSYLFALFYFAVAAGAVTHEDLFFERAVKLPFLNIELPLLAFFFVAPILFVIVHAYTLVHLVMLTDKARLFDEELYKQIGALGFSTKQLEERKSNRDGFRRLLPSNIFIHFLVKTEGMHDRGFGWLLHAIGLVTLVLAPLLSLLLMQIQFLPFHSLLIIWIQRVSLCIDLILLWWLWRRVVSVHKNPSSLLIWRIWDFIRVSLSVALVVFSVMVVTFPNEPQEQSWPIWQIFPSTDGLNNLTAANFFDKVKNAPRISLHDWLFDAEPNPVTRRRLPFSSTLVLPGLNIYEGLGIDDPEKAKWRDYIFYARGRDLSGAIFDSAILPKVDFTGARLQGASFRNAQLQGAIFACERGREGSRPVECTHLQGASFDGAGLQGASLIAAQLVGASLNNAQLQGATLDLAPLIGASLDGAQLQGASLDSADLEGASLVGAQLEGAALHGARLQGAVLGGAVLKATDLSDTSLWRINVITSPKGDHEDAVSIRIRDTNEFWLPVEDKDYQRLRKIISENVPSGYLRDQAFTGIERLDCSSSARLGSCDTSPKRPPEVTAGQEMLETASVDEKAFGEALAGVFRELVCSVSDETIHVVRGLSRDATDHKSRLEEAGPAASRLIDDLLKDGKKCPVAAALTEADRAKLTRIQHLLERGK
jgi:uncharacterized protein YjbI with pentapeptide repeats